MGFKPVLMYFFILLTITKIQNFLQVYSAILTTISIIAYCKCDTLFNIMQRYHNIDTDNVFQQMNSSRTYHNWNLNNDRSTICNTSDCIDVALFGFDPYPPDTSQMALYIEWVGVYSKFLICVFFFCTVCRVFTFTVFYMGI